MMPFLKKHWPLLGIGIFLLGVGLYVIGAQKGIVKESFFADLIPENGLKLENICYTQNDPDEGMRWVLEAKEGTLSKDKTVCSFMDFRLKLEPQDRPHIEVEGKRGYYDQNSGEINLHGDVCGYTDNGYRIVTDYMQYKEKEGYFITDKPVKIFGPFFSVAGQGLYCDPEQQILRIVSDVTTVIDRDLRIL